MEDIKEYINILGNAYWTLAKVENKAENCKGAIKIYKELKVRTLDRFSTEYAITQEHLGNVYWALAEVEDTAENCKRAFSAYEEALKVYTLARFPIDYAMPQNNLGNAYWTLAEVEDKAENCKKAFKAYNEALKVFEKEGLTEPCQLVQRNLVRLRVFCGGHTP